MNEERNTAIRHAWYDAEKLRPYRVDADLLAQIIPAGGNWECRVPEGCVTRSVHWGGVEVCIVNARGDLGDSTEGNIAMALAATPVMDKALRVILALSQSSEHLSLIADIARTAIAFIERPAPRIPRPDEDDDEDAEL